MRPCLLSPRAVRTSAATEARLRTGRRPAARAAWWAAVGAERCHADRADSPGAPDPRRRCDLRGAGEPGARDTALDDVRRIGQLDIAAVGATPDSDRALGGRGGRAKVGTAPACSHHQAQVAVRLRTLPKGCGAALPDKLSELEHRSTLIPLAAASLVEIGVMGFGSCRMDIRTSVGGVAPFDCQKNTISAVADQA